MDGMGNLPETLISIRKLNKDLKVAAITLNDKEARFLVDSYYVMQDGRKRLKSQDQAMNKDGEPHQVLSWMAEQAESLENEIQKSLDIYSSSHVMGPWMRGVYGIGPVLAAGLLAHIDITKCPTVGHIWSYAGIAGTNQKKWEAGQKRPWNADLKVLVWKCGDSFMKLSNKEKCFYGHLYRERKALEIERNKSGLFADQAAFAMAKLKRKNTDTYKANAAGVLSDGHIDARARRYAVKHFLSDLHCVWYFTHHGVLPPLPFVIEHMGHVHYRLPSNIHLVPGLQEAFDKAPPPTRRTE
jgi:hypothetical protein